MGECEGGSVGRVEWEGGRGVEWKGGGRAGTESVGGGALVSN